MASCWICLDDGPDRHGKPPVRDCSCRGDDAGFAHVSCVVEYARRKSSEADYPADFIDPWNRCEHCKHDYQNELRIDLLDEFKRFVDEQYPCYNWRHLAVQNQLVGEVVTRDVTSPEKQEEIIDTTLSIIDHLSMHPDPTIDPRSFDYLKAGPLNMIGQIRLDQEDLTEDEAKKCLGYLEEGRKIKESFGDAVEVAELEATSAYFKARCIERFGAQEAFGELESLEQLIERRRKAYQMRLENYAEASPITNGIILSILLRKANRTIEAWRLLKRLIAISTQHHGREHRSTKELEETLATFKCDKIQIVTLRTKPSFRFVAVGDDDDDKYVLRGPLCVPEEGINTLTVDPTDVILESNGTPVVCRGLKNNAAYLNGKIGDIRSFDETTGRYGVYFEDESIKPKSVKPRNLRILFELPDN
jgi:hypothetical protein